MAGERPISSIAAGEDGTSRAGRLLANMSGSGMGNLLNLVIW